jgi:hypothetical protein
MRGWVREARASDAVVCIGYHTAPGLFIRIHLASLLGKPVIRWWVGTDVYNALTSPAIAHDARRMDRYVAANIAVAPHLRDELASVGIDASVIGIPSHRQPEFIEPTWSSRIARSVLAYVPSSKPDFYGGPVVEQLARAMPELTFCVVRDEAGMYRHLPNVVSMPYVEDMDSLYRKAGCLLRMTRHDGLPRMVLEALARGRYVVYAWPLEGCIPARTFEQAQAALAQIAAATEPNRAGMHLMQRYDLDREFYQPWTEVVGQAPRSQRWRTCIARVRVPLDVPMALVRHLRAALHRPGRREEPPTRSPGRDG